MFLDTTADCHIHTPLCHHATGTMEEYVLSAMKKGLKKVYFLEHMEEGIRTDHITWLTDDDFSRYFEEGTRLRHKYSGDILVGLGVEVGYNPEARDTLLQRISRFSWDIIGVSCHFYPYGPASRHLNLVSRRDPLIKQLSRPETGSILKEYYTLLREAAEQIPADMVCHLDAALRYSPHIDSIAPPWHHIERLLDVIAARNMAIEVNTSGQQIRGEPFPCRAIMEKAVKRGIALKASSDAHKPEQVGGHFDMLHSLYR